MKMRGLFIVLLAFLAIFYALSGDSLRAEENEEEAENYVVHQRKGLKIRAPEDWPIEKIGNTYGPIPIEQYVARSFKKINERLDALEANYGELSAKLEELSDNQGKSRRLSSASEDEEERESIYIKVGG